jgi:hypothetical protein
VIMCINVFATAKSGADGCWSNCPTNRSLSNQQKPERMANSLTSLQCYEVKGDDFLLCLVEHQWRGCNTTVWRKRWNPLYASIPYGLQRVGLKQLSMSGTWWHQSFATFKYLYILWTVHHIYIYIYIYICENDQQDAHFYSFVYFD